MKKSSTGRGTFLTGFIVTLIALMAALAIYIYQWYAELSRIEWENARYQAMYVTPEPTEVPEETPSPTPESTPKVPEETPSPTPESTPKVPEETPVPTTEPTHEVPEETPSPTSEPTATPQPLPMTSDELLPTPGPETLVYALPTPPPVQGSFAVLLKVNPETVGYLTLGELVSLPVVQRENDNEYYLTHSFSGEVKREGALFLDGINRLSPEDDCLIVYGHNMKNGTMFGRLDELEQLNNLKANALVRFDTVYENHSYLPFAAFTASMDKNSDRYFEVRRFLMTPEEFEEFAGELKRRSRFEIPVDVGYGDDILLLVTCDYSNTDGRFILALRKLRPGETEDDAREMVARAK